jgi:acyl transferase domain-containing protein
MPVAIVGIGCRFPGGVTDAESFWDLLLEGRDAIGQIPADRFDLSHYYDERPATPGRVMARWGGFLDRIEDFDAAFFGISPLEAERLDPQQRLLLETGWEALEDAGQDIGALAGSNTGVFVGQWLSDFEARLFARPEEVDFFMTTGSGRYATSGRISYLLGLRGPSLTLDTACSSSLVAVHLAVRSIRSGESSLALAGGANIILQPHISIAYSQSRMMAPDGRCKFCDASGDGYVRSEGAAIVVLKPLSKAQADGDRIYAVIRGSAVNNDGRSSGSMGTPSRIGQEELLRAAYADAGVSPGAVGYVEAHGTGTRAGDPVELGALGAILGAGRARGQQALVGSVKTNIGHTEGAAGIAGLVKTALALHHEVIPRSLHFKQPNPAIQWADAPFDVARAARPWLRADQPRFAGVSAFGIAGTNAHVVLEEAPGRSEATTRSSPTHDPAILPLSARSEAGLRALAGRYADCLSDVDGCSLTDLCWSAATRRSALEQRAAFVACDASEMAGALRAYASGGGAAAEGAQHAPVRPKLAFVLPGQGAQWPGMARAFAASSEVFRAALEECDAAARPYVDWSIVEQIHAEPDSPASLLDRIDVVQPVLVALAIAYAKWLYSLGILPDALVGHSMGEVAAAHLSGAIELDQAMRIICRRSALMRRTSGQGAMALVDLSMAEAQARLMGRESRVSVAVSNGPRSSVISGEPQVVQEMLAEFESEGLFCRLVKVDVASHSPQMEPLARELVAELAGSKGGTARVPVYSTVLGRRCDGTELGADYWGRNLRQPVRFSEAVGRLIDDGVSVFLELSPHPLLSAAIGQTAQAKDREVVTLCCGRREEPDLLVAHGAVAGLWAAGIAPVWQAVLPGIHRGVTLPLYPWQRERHWADAADSEPVGAAASSNAAALARPDDESLGWLYRQEWPALADPIVPLAGEVGAACWLVVTDDDKLAAAVVNAARAAGVLCRAASLDALAQALVPTGSPECPTITAVVALCARDEGAAYLPLQLLQSVLGAVTANRPRLWFVTRGAQPVTADSSQRLPIGQAALWGAARVLAEEHPELWGGLVDLDPSLTWESSVQTLMTHLIRPDGEDQVALRGNRRHALRLMRYRMPPRRHTPLAWRSDAAYLISGGQGDIGLHLARMLVAQGARRLILLGRTALPPREQWSNLAPDHPLAQRVIAIRGIEAMGAAVHAVAVDVADEAAMRAFLESYRAEAWPPIRGVIHAAGSFDNRLASGMDRAAFDSVLEPKLRGAQVLDRLLPDLDLFVLFSSTGAFLVQPGQANYAAANAGLDALALDRRARGLPAQSIAWGVWQGTGLVAWLCGCDEPALAVLPIDWGTFRKARAGREMVMFRVLTTEVAAGPQPTDAATVAERLKSASATERRALLDAIVREIVGKVLKLAPARIDPRKAFGAMGLGSLMAMELRNRLEAVLGRSFSATLAWNYPTVEALVAHLAGAEPAGNAPMAKVTEAAVSASASSSLGAALEQVVELSDDEAAMALLGRRGRGAR